MADLNYTIRLRDLLSRKLGGIINKTKRLDQVVTRTQGSFARFGGALGLVGGAIGLARFGKSTVEALTNYEFFSASLRTLMKGDKTAASALQSQLIEFAKVTPFSLLEVQQGSKQLLATGTAVGDITDELRMLGDVAAGVSVPLDRVILNFGQVRAQGKLTGRELRDFAVAGIPIKEVLAKNLGVTKKAITDMVSAGEIGFDKVKEAFKTMTGEGGRFFNLMDAQSKTVGGRLANLGDSWEQLQVNIGKSQRGLISGTVDWVAKMVSALEDMTSETNEMEAAFKKLGQTGEGVSFFDAIINPFGAIKRIGAEEDKFLPLQRNIKGRLEGAAKDESKTIKLIADLESERNKLEAKRDRSKALEQGAEKLKGRVKERSLISIRAKGDFLSESDFLKKFGQFSRGIDKAVGNLRILKTGSVDLEDGETPGATPAGGAAGGLGTGAEVSGRRPQNINITIESLVEQLTIESETMELGADQVKEKVAEVLIEAVNDINTIAR